MPISADIMVAILKAVRDHEISARERARAMSPTRSPADVNTALSREAALQDALQEALALGQRDTATPLVQAAAGRLGLVFDQEDPSFAALAHHATRLLIEVSAERARREMGDYGHESVLAAAMPAASQQMRPSFQSRRRAYPQDILAKGFGQAATTEAACGPHSVPVLAPAARPALWSDIQAQPVYFGASRLTEAMPEALVPSPAQACFAVTTAGPKPAPIELPPLQPPALHPALLLPQEPEARRRAFERALPDLRIDKSVLSDAAKEALLDPWSLSIEEAFDCYFEVKLAGYGDEFFKTQKRLPSGGRNWQRNSEASLVVAKRIWSDLLGNCKLREVTDDQLDRALLILARLPKHHGKVYKDDSITKIIDTVDALEIAQEAKAYRTIERTPGISQDEADKLLLNAKIPRLRVETYFKHGRAMGRIGRFLEGLGLLPRSPFALCSWTHSDEKSMRAAEESKAREPWDDRIYDLFRTPVFQGESDGPGDPLFWLPLLASHCGPRMEEGAQLAPDDISVEDGIPYLRIRNCDGNSVKSSSGERKIPIHPNLIVLGFMDLVDMRRREGAGRLFPDLCRGETKGTRSELFSKAFGYYRKTHNVYWPGLDYHALRTTFHTFLLNSDRVPDARRRRLMGHSPIDEGEKSYAQGLRMSTLLADIEDVKFDISMIQSPFPSTSKVVSLQGLRHRAAAV